MAIIPHKEGTLSNCCKDRQTFDPEIKSELISTVSHVNN